MTLVKFAFCVLVMVCVWTALGFQTAEDHRKSVEEVKKKELKDCFGYAKDTTKAQGEIDKLFEKELKKELKKDPKLNLEKLEADANEKLMILKEYEIELGVRFPDKMYGAYDIFDVLDDMECTKLFGLIRTMPKFGVLHLHQTAIMTHEYMANLPTRKQAGEYYKYMWLGHHPENELDIRGFEMSKVNTSKEITNTQLLRDYPDTIYTKVEDVVTRLGNGSFAEGELAFVEILKPVFTLNKWDKTKSKSRFGDIGA